MDRLIDQTELLKEVIKTFKARNKRLLKDERFRIIHAEISKILLPHITASSEHYFIRVDMRGTAKIYLRASEIGVCPKIIDTYAVETKFGYMDCVLRELVTGVSLGVLLESKLVDLKKIERLLDRKIKTMHGSGIAHNDLKPAHVFIVLEEDEVRDLFLIDFGESVLREYGARKFDEARKADLRDLKNLKSLLRK